MKKYNYLKEFINSISEEPNANYFGKISNEEIKINEKRIGFQFPLSLKNFWLEIGYGFLTKSIKGEETINNNRILFPQEIADIILLKEDSNYILSEVADYFSKEVIPFFEIADMASFLVMKPYSEKPEAIYNLRGMIVEQSLEKFIWRLYYESPTFYLDIPDPKYDEYLAKEEAKRLADEERKRNAPPAGILFGYVQRNYRKQLYADGLLEELSYGGEPFAELMIKKYNIPLNHCPHCGNLKMTPQARQCLKCGEFHDPRPE